MIAIHEILRLNILIEKFFKPIVSLFLFNTVLSKIIFQLF